MRYAVTSILILFVGVSLSSLAQNEGELAPEVVYEADTIIWFGADFGLFKLSNPKKMGDDEKLKDYVYAWNEEFKFGLSNVKIASLFEKKKVINDRQFTDELAVEFNVRDWVINEKFTLSIEDVERRVLDYPSENSGIGLVYIIENFYKSNVSELNGYFVFFDIESRDVLYMYKSSGKPSTVYYTSNGGGLSHSKRMPKNTGMIGFWYRGMIDAVVDFSVNYKSGIIKEEKEY